MQKLTLSVCYLFRPKRLNCLLRNSARNNSVHLDNRYGIFLITIVETTRKYCDTPQQYTQMLNRIENRVITGSM